MGTLKSIRLHIGVFGKTNVGKSSLLNRITNQEISIVSDIAGTTTDVVEKSMELLPIGPVTFLDTAGLDDKSDLGQQRVEKTFKILNRTDVAVIVIDGNGFGIYEKELIQKLDELKIPYLVVVNKCDDKILCPELEKEFKNIVYTSVKTDEQFIFKFKNALVKLLPEDFVNSPKIIGDLVEPKSTVILVIPIDKEAPKGRIILPQVQTLRDLLDSDCLTYVVKENELKQAIENLKTPPALVVTDSQAFRQVSEIVPENIPLTSFSILFARLKGDLAEFVKGAKAIENLKDGDLVLILESCTHHAIEDDIGRVKIPNLLRKKTGKNLVIHNFAGHDFPNIKDYKLIIHCGACMTNRREVLSRILLSSDANVPITNYGVAISYCLGILPRAVKIFEDKI
jgi:[FeFe] hydrogenase H-cluster maturation GTPase HydF